MQHAIDAEAHHPRIASRLDVDVGGALFERVLPQPIDDVDDVLIVGVGCLAAWYGYKLCVLNLTTRTPGLELSLAWLYGSAVVGGLLIILYGISMIVARSSTASSFGRSPAVVVSAIWTSSS